MSYTCKAARTSFKCIIYTLAILCCFADMINGSWNLCMGHRVNIILHMLNDT